MSTQDTTENPTVESIVPDCHYCEESLSIIKGGPQVNGLHGECAELVHMEMDVALGSRPIYLIEE